MTSKNAAATATAIEAIEQRIEFHKDCRDRASESLLKIQREGNMNTQEMREFYGELIVAHQADIWTLTERANRLAELRREVETIERDEAEAARKSLRDEALFGIAGDEGLLDDTTANQQAAIINAMRRAYELARADR